MPERSRSVLGRFYCVITSVLNTTEKEVNMLEPVVVVTDVDSKLTGEVLHSYACLNCITVLSNHFYCCVLPYVYLITRVTLELKSPAI